MKYIVIDPSGSFNEGKGHTGIVTLIDNDWSTLNVCCIYANKYSTRVEYWTTMIKYVLTQIPSDKNVRIVIESFLIRSNGFTLGKMPETILFIGALIYALEVRSISYVLQTPAQAKARFKDELLPKYIPNLIRKPNGWYTLNGQVINDHMRDALKHLLFYKKYGEKNDVTKS